MLDFLKDFHERPAVWFVSLILAGAWGGGFTSAIVFGPQRATLDEIAFNVLVMRRAFERVPELKDAIDKVIEEENRLNIIRGGR